MGFEDRDYYQENYGGQSFRASGGSGFGGQRSMLVTIIVINAVVFLADMFSPEVAADHTQWISKQLSLDSGALWKFWGFLTHGFAHSSMMTESGIFHILFNMLNLFFLGGMVERRLGKYEFLRFYLISIVVSGIGWLAWVLATGAAGSFIVGASGAVSAVTAYFIFMAPKATLLMMGILPMQAWVVGILFLGVNLMHAMDPNGHIAWQAHLVGAAFGALYFHLNWNFGRFDFGLEKFLSREPRLKVHDPSAADEDLKRQADKILAKINDQGEASLTKKERKILNKYSERLRNSRNE
jgi:membrane associated rhomboid family serine protease